MEPHPVLTEHYETAADKRAFLRRLFDRTAPHYESITRWGFFGSGDWYRRDALRRAGLRPGMRVLDVATGTGTVARAATRLTGGTQGLLCLDPSGGMLAVARQTLGAACVQGEADHLPVRGEQFDFLTMGFALRHVASLAGTFHEYHRVLKPGGKLLVLEVTRSNSPVLRGLMRLYMRGLLPRLTRWLTGEPETATLMRYYWDTVAEMAPAEQVLAALRAAGFASVGSRVWFGMFTEYTAVKG